MIIIRDLSYASAYGQKLKLLQNSDNNDKMVKMDSKMIKLFSFAYNETVR